MPHQCTTCDKVFPDGSKEMLSGCPNCGGNKFQFKPKTGTGGAASSSDDAPTQSGAGARDLTSSAADAVRERVEQTDVRPGTTDEEMTVSDWVQAKDEPAPPADTGGTDSRPEPASESPADRTDEDATREWGEWPDAPDDSGTSSPSPSDETPPEPSSGTKPHIHARETDEDTSQKSARSDVVSPEELAAADANHRRSTEQSRPGVTPADGDDTPDSQAASPDDAPPTTDGTTIEPPSDERPNLDELREELNDQFESIKIVNPGQYELNLMELYDRDEYIISLREDGRYVIEVPDSWGPGARED